MSYSVKQGDIFGRIGTGLGQGLAESLPREIERGRLAQGLRQFEEQSGNLTPMQQLARLSAIPGITPQMIQSFSELAKQQNIRSAFGKGRRGTEDEKGVPEAPIKGSSAQAIKDVPFSATQSRPGRSIPADQVGRDEFGQSKIVETNPLRQAAIPAKPWTPERWNDEVSNIWDQNPGLNFDQVKQLASEKEARYLTQPAAERERDDYLRSVQEAVDNKFTKQLETKLQKEGTGVFQNITGENLINLKRGMEKELRENPNADVDDVVNKWTNRALNFSKSKSQLKKLANRDILDKIFKPGQTLNSLKAYQKTYQEADNLEEFYNFLRTPNKPPDELREGEISGFGMSPQVAAQIAYPRSKLVKDFINKIRTDSKGNVVTNSYKLADEFFKKNIISDDDSILAIVRDLRDKHPYFDQRGFFDYLKDNQDRLRLSELQKREIQEGQGDITPNWGDIWVLPGGYYE